MRGILERVGRFMPTVSLKEPPASRSGTFKRACAGLGSALTGPGQPRRIQSSWFWRAISACRRVISSFTARATMSRIRRLRVSCTSRVMVSTAREMTGGQCVIHLAIQQDVATAQQPLQHVLAHLAARLLQSTSSKLRGS